MSQDTQKNDLGGSIEPIPELILEGLPKEHRASAQKAVSRYVQITHESYTSPIPPPKILAQYEEILSGSVDRILTYVEKQQAHRQGMEREVIKSNILNEKLGLGAAFILSAIISVGGIYLISADKDITGLTILIGETVVLVSAFYYAQWQRRKERKERAQVLTDQPQKKLPEPASQAKKSTKRSRRNR